MEDKTSIKQQIREHIRENILFGNDDVLDDNTSFTESGILDSTGFLQLITFLEETYGIEVSDEELDPENLETLAKISHFIENKLDKKTST